MAMWGEAAIERKCGFVPIPQGIAYRIDSPPRNAMVTPELAGGLNRVLECFAREAGFGAGWPVGIFFRPGIFGHHRVGRAADIYAVGGLGIEVWRSRWDEAQRTIANHEGAVEREKARNLGWKLYKALQRYGRWSQPCGYPMQLFGPWTRTEGPWKNISDFLLHAHRDHIHVAK
jgi:hypothetical protein